MSVSMVADRPAVAGCPSVAEAMTPSPSELRSARRRLHAKALMIALLAGTSYWALVFAASSIVALLISAVALTLALVAVATGVFHDGNHASFSTSRLVNRVAAYTGDLLGASSWIWRFKHNNLHHGNTNVDGVDTDIDQSPFARLTTAQAWRPWHRFQHVYMWFLYGFLTLQWFLVSDLINLRQHGVGDQRFPRQPRRRDVASITAGKALHVGWALVVPFLFRSWWVVLTFYVAISWVVGLVLAMMFQLAHCTDLVEFPDASAPRRGADFVDHQLATTADVRCRTEPGRRVLQWLMGGLDYQVEHHLAPRLPHTVYPVVAERLAAACTAAGRHLRVHVTPWSAIRAHGRWLKAMGVRPAVVIAAGR